MTEKRKCPQCEGTGVLQGFGKFRNFVLRLLRIDLDACWQCKGNGKIIIDDSEMLGEFTEVFGIHKNKWPEWLKSLQIFVCLPCLDDEQILVLISLEGEDVLGNDYEAFAAFSENAIRMRCPRCSRCLPQYRQKHGHATESLWLPIRLIHGSILETVKFFRYVLRSDSEEWTEVNE